MSNTSSSGSSIKSEETGPVAGDGVLRLSARQETRLADPGRQQARAGRPVEMRLEWRIREVEKLLKAYDHKECLPSKPFLFPQAPNVLWQLDFYPNGRNEPGAASIHLSQMESMPDSVVAHIHLYLIDKSGEQVPLNRVKHSFSSFDHVGSEKLLTRARLRKALHADGSMLVVCEGTFTVPPQQFESILLAGEEDGEGEESVGTPEQETGLQGTEGAEGPATVVVISGEGQLCQMTDCVLEAGGKAIPVHGHLLRQHSSMLGSMLDTRRGQGVDVLRLGQYSAEAAEAVVEYIYRGSISAEGLENRGVELLRMADDYMMRGLSRLVLGHITSRITHQNVIPLFLEASQRSIEPLRESCVGYFSQHSPEIIGSPQWVELERANLKQAYSLLKQFGKSFKAEDPSLADSRSQASGEPTAPAINQLPTGDQPLVMPLRPIKRSRSQAGSDDEDEYTSAGDKRPRSA